MIDLHCHLLPGIDDGPDDLEAALAQARVHVEAGITTVVCTPHVSHGHHNTAASIAAATQSFQQSLVDAGIPLTVKPGAEVSLSRAIELPEDELAALHLGGSEWLLLEPPLGSEVPRLADLVLSLHSRGHHVLLAHPERCKAFHNDASLLATLVEGGARSQITAGSLTGQFGRTVRKLATEMVRDGLMHVIASDAHDAEHRPPGLAGPLAEAGLDKLTPWACDAVPTAMLAGDPLPPRPDGTAPRRGRKLFRR